MHEDIELKNVDMIKLLIWQLPYLKNEIKNIVCFLIQGFVFLIFSYLQSTKVWNY